MNNTSQYDRTRQIALYLLRWGEAAWVRFVSECLCFIFKCANDCYRSPECQSCVQPVKEGLWLSSNRSAPLSVINQSFLYPDSIAQTVLIDNVSTFPPSR